MTTLDKAGTVLGALSDAPSGSSLASLETATQIPKPTLYRILRSLIDCGLAHQDGSGRYQPGIRLFELAANAYSRIRLEDRDRQALIDLATQTHLAVHLSAFRGNQLIYVDKIAADTPFQMRSEIGRIQAIHSSAIGKSVLAHLDPGHARTLLEHRPRQQFTPYTVTKVDDILKLLPPIRSSGYAIDDEEDELTTRAIAAPLLAADGTPRGGISIVAPTFEVSKADLEDLAPEIIRAARAVSGA
jgi:DNA-binding IclR family transcriptional regulator